MGIKEFNEASESLYIWDRVEGKGFPLTDDIMCIDLSQLSHDERLIIAGTNKEEILELMQREGGTLSGLLEMSVRVFRQLVQKLYMHESDEKKMEIQELVRRTLESSIDSMFDEDDED
jgi:hypothetical protein